MDITEALSAWSTRPGPLHLRLSQALADAIDGGDLPSNAKLPSERGLARRLVISRSTVVAAYRALESEGLIEGRQGSGTYVTAHRGSERYRDGSAAGRLTSRIDTVGTDVISLAVAAVPPSDRLQYTFDRTARENLDALVRGDGYQFVGLRQLRDAVAAALAADGLPTAATQVVVTTGAHQALNLCASVLVRPGDWVAIEDPTYPGSIDAFAAAGARLVSLDVDEEGVIPESLERALSSRSISAVCVSPTFHNPTGALLTGHRRRRIAQIVSRYDTPVVEDQVLRYAGLRQVDLPHPLASYLRSDYPIITVGSASKVFWSGLRTGWLRASEPLLTRLARRKASADLGSSVIDQRATANLFEELPVIVDSLHEQLRDHLARMTDLLGQTFPSWTWGEPDGGASLWVDTKIDADRFAQVAMRHGVEIIPGSAFSSSGQWATHIRLPFVHDATTAARAFERLLEAWQAFPTEGALPSRANLTGAVV